MKAGFHAKTGGEGEGEKLWPIYGRRVCPLNGSGCHRHTRSVLRMEERRGFDVVQRLFLYADLDTNFSQIDIHEG